MRRIQPDTRNFQQVVLAALTSETAPIVSDLLNKNKLYDLVKAVVPGVKSMTDQDGRTLSSSLRGQNVYKAIDAAVNDYMPPQWEHGYIPGKLLPEYQRELNQIRLMTIGCGPTTLFPTATAVFLGVRPENVTGFTKGLPAKWGGMWVEQPTGPGAQFNNPLPLTTPYGELPDLGEKHRGGERMRRFLRLIAERSKLTDRVYSATVRGLVLNTNIFAIREDYQSSEPSDLVFVGLGNKPKPLATGKMQTDATQYESEIHRWQKPFSEAEARNLNGKVVLIVGLGNSALRQINFVKEANQKYGVSIRTIVITHFTSNGIKSPFKTMPRSDGTPGTVARDPKNGNLVDLELDLKESRKQYYAFIKNTVLHHRDKDQKTILEGILPSVTGWYVRKNGDQNYTVTAKVSELYEEATTAGDYIIENVGAIFVLGGYHTDPRELKNFGFQIDSNGRAITRPQNGALVRNGEANTRVFLTGFAVANEITRNPGTMPGAFARLPDQMLAVLLHAILLSKSR